MAVTGDPLQRGSVVGGYRIDELISRGGMGLVYRATNVALNRIYALKVLAPGLAEDAQFRERFKREMRIAASLHHPNIVGIHNAGEHDGMLFFVMDYVAGTDLRDVLVKHGAMEPSRVVDLLDQFSSALDAAHGRGLVHRDVKPANILITVKDGEEHAYLTDFGLAKKYDTASGLTAKGAVVGTVDYMSPEQITGSHTDARTDIYALGCVVYQMLSGKVPYERENSVATLFAHVYDPPPSLEGETSETYPAFAPVLEKAMAKDPSQRYFSAGDFARDATAALKGMRYTAPPTIVGTGDATPVVKNAEPTAPPQAPPATPPVEAGEAAQPVQASEFIAPARPGASPESPGSEVPPPRPAVPAETNVSESPSPREDVPVLAAEATSVPAAADPTSVPAGADPTSAASAQQQPSSSPSPPTAAPASSPPAASRPATTPPPAPPAPPPSAQPTIPPAGDSGGAAGGAKPSRNRYLLPGLGALVLIVGAVVAVIALSSSGSSKPSGTPFAASLTPVPTNQVTGKGSGTVRLNGSKATITLDANGLLNGAPHAMHIHAGGKGVCPPASAARPHNGHLSISTGNGIAFYGPPQVSLTSTGDTSPKSIIDFSRYPSTGTIRYQRTITIPPGVADAIRAGNAAMIVHGIDYNHNGVYDNVLDRSDLNNALPGEATAPAICGSLVASQTASVGGSSGSTRTYAFVLNRRVAASSALASNLALACDLLGADVGALSDPRRTAATAT
ncbi:MAG TPA: serine/threonine-protein kinase [Solirubrobacteraceae bacterium]